MNTGALKSARERSEQAIDAIAQVLGDREGSWEAYRQIIEAAITEAEEAMIERMGPKMQETTQVIVEMVRERAAKIAEQAAIIVKAKPDATPREQAESLGAEIAAFHIASQIRAMKITAGDLKR